MFVLAFSAVRLPALLDVNVKTGDVIVLYSSGDVTTGMEYMSIPEKITYPSGSDLKDEAHAYFYAPKAMPTFLQIEISR